MDISPLSVPSLAYISLKKNYLKIKWLQCHSFILQVLESFYMCKHGPWKKNYDNLDSILKSRDIALLTKAHIVKTMVFPIVMYGCKCWIIKKAEHQRTDAFELWCWKRLLRVPWTARRSNQSILREIKHECSLEGLMLKLKLQYLPPDAKN